MAKKNGQPTAEAAPPSQAERPRPAAEIRIGRLRAAIWANQSAEQGTWYSVSPTRSYKDKDDAWKTSTSFGRDDLLVLSEILRQAFHWINTAHQTERQQVASANGERQPIEDASNSDPIPF